jgi:NADP-dependent 3-hydroxy acid dehydrogenase YdfG
MNVDGNIAVITGASSGLGASLANALVTKGTTVYGLARNAVKLLAIKNKLGEKFIPVDMDITNQKKYFIMGTKYFF